VTHLAAMRERLPLLLREGELAASLLGLPALQLEIADEEALAVQRAHWFEAVLELEEAARLAAVLDLAPEPWQDLGTFRAWVQAMRTAIVEEGASTRPALERFATDYVERYQAVRRLTVWDSTRGVVWSDAPTDAGPAFVENPKRRGYGRVPAAGGIEPLHQFSVVNRGLDETAAALLLTGLPSAPESVPVVANVTTGEAIAFLGDVPPGARLWVRAEEDGSATARLERADVTGRLRSVGPVAPGKPWGPPDVRVPAQALRLARGRNDLWFLPVAHFDERGLDRFLLALADLAMRQGRWDETAFDHSLFFQEAAVVLRLTWVETAPATFRLELPGGAMLSRPGDLDDALEDRELLATSLDAGVTRLRAAGVDGRAAFVPYTETQGQHDAVVAVLPHVVREPGPTGADRLPDAGGLWEITDFDESTFR
jgi:hypothetical protein